ncbi:MAG: hypothetical protein M3N93_15520 [Acidobacteriota bacterium]|nr:hypothetical protein [Acidobacteriota bacterium]
MEGGEKAPLAVSAPALIFDVQPVGIDGLPAGDAFDAGKQAAVIAFVGLESHATFFAAIVPGQPHEMFFGFAERHQRAKTQRDYGETYGSAHAAVHILPITDLGDGGCRYRDQGLIVADKPDLILVDIFQFVFCVSGAERPWWSEKWENAWRNGCARDSTVWRSYSRRGLAWRFKTQMAPAISMPFPLLWAVKSHG